MDKLKYVKAMPLTLRNHPEFTEVWLHDRIAEDPSILGMGDLALLDRERKQPKAGRLDLLLVQPDENRRYEVEIMLGKTDESHIIRTLEYWDIERRRYPGYDHIAVLVAEDITSRFLNVLSLFAGSIPFIAIQLNALNVDKQIVLNFARVIDFTSLRQDDESENNLIATDRNYWNDRSTTQMVSLVDELLQKINEQFDESPMQLNYNKYYIGLVDGHRSRNFIHFRPKKKIVQLLVEVDDKELWTKQLEDKGFDVSVVKRWIKVPLTTTDINKNTDILNELITAAIEKYKCD